MKRMMKITLKQLHELAGVDMIPYLDKYLGNDQSRELTMKEVYWTLLTIRFKILIETLEIFYRKNLEGSNVKQNRIDCQTTGR